MGRRSRIAGTAVTLSALAACAWRGGGVASTGGSAMDVQMFDLRALKGMPVEVLEVAQIDGVGLVRTLREVMSPVVMPGIAAAGLICCIFTWIELLLARMLTGTVAGTAPVYLTVLVNSRGLFLAQDKLVQGLSMGAVK